MPLQPSLLKSARCLGIALGAGLGLLFAFLVAAMPSPNGKHYYFEIMLPGFVVGAIIGFLTQKLGVPRRTAVRES